MANYLRYDDVVNAVLGSIIHPERYDINAVGAMLRKIDAGEIKVLFPPIADTQQPRGDL